jgi:hypothetical protein
MTIDIGLKQFDHNLSSDLRDNGVSGSKKNVNNNVNNNGWINPIVDDTKLNVNGTSASALLAAMFDLGEKSADLGRTSSMMSTHNSLTEAQRNLADMTKATHDTFKSDLLNGIGQLAGSVVTLGAGAALSTVGKLGPDTGFSVSGNFAGITSASFALGANPDKQEAGLAQADSQVANTYENLDQKWSDNSTGTAGTIMAKIQSVNEALANIVGQAAQTRASSY